MWLLTVIPRAFQFLFAIIVLGLSVTLAKGQVQGSVPATIGYGSFTGGLGFVAAVVGFAALFVGFLDGIISWALDGFAGVAFLAGGIAFAIGLQGTDCPEDCTTVTNALLSGGLHGSCVRNDTDGSSQVRYNGDTGNLNTRCTSAKADEAFLFLGFFFCMFVIAGSMFSSRNKRNQSGSVV
ncbi:hypothetical protein Egran_03345 [Elaphomyces granulatus]|uniref:MARVEL domain-containing protein n=1 Tax=Elaphomyces granulatus TaxID=519963 RepID=A0A232LXP4_9EURO|nr:hypothetical protein Egran_03345 [Elaphomyces granulatus]